MAYGKNKPISYFLVLMECDTVEKRMGLGGDERHPEKFAFEVTDSLTPSRHPKPGDKPVRAEHARTVVRTTRPRYITSYNARLRLCCGSSQSAVPRVQVFPFLRRPNGVTSLGQGDNASRKLDECFCYKYYDYYYYYCWCCYYLFIYNNIVVVFVIVIIKCYCVYEMITIIINNQTRHTGKKINSQVDPVNPVVLLSVRNFSYKLYMYISVHS